MGEMSKSLEDYPQQMRCLRTARRFFRIYMIRCLIRNWRTVHKVNCFFDGFIRIIGGKEDSIWTKDIKGVAQGRMGADAAGGDDEVI